MNYSDVVNTLSRSGIDVAQPGAKPGICTSPYVVVQNAGTYRYAQSAGLGYTLVSVHCYTPLYAYEQLMILIERVKSALRCLEPDLRYAGNEAVHIINDSFRANEGSVQYLIQRSLTPPDSERNSEE